MKRKAGILCPIFSLPSKYGIGTIGEEAYKFVDFLVDTGQSYWQILPLGHTENGSPYEVISAFAGNPYLIDVDLLIEEKLLKNEDLLEIPIYRTSNKIQYKKLYRMKEKILRKAYENSNPCYQTKIKDFLCETEWLEEYALYNALNHYLGTKSWLEWEQDLKHRNEKVLAYYKDKLNHEIHFWYFVQYIFAMQWKKLKEYTDSKNIKIIGDLPFYVSKSSVDVWENPQLFLLDDNLEPVEVAGCPPDNFSSDGQYWGYPVYNWEENKKTNYGWWHNRIIYSKKMFDLIRLDHFIGFERTWNIPASSGMISDGKWVKGPGYDFFIRLFQKNKKLSLISEDLGAVDKDIIKLREQVGCYGMKVLLLGFDSREPIDYRPHTYEKNTIAYTSVHDTDTVMGWFESADNSDIEHAVTYLNLTKKEGYNWGMIRGCFSSVSMISIIQLQDILGYGSWSRTNRPPFLEDNWVWQLDDIQKLYEYKDKLYDITKCYERLG